MMIRDLDGQLWRKASASGTQGGSSCVELHPVGAIRDSKNVDGPQLRVPFGDLVAAVKTDRLAR
jgi:hypothetical protein